MKRMKTAVFFIVLLLSCVSMVGIVNSEVDVIQDLIDDACCGDVLYLPEGTYYEHLVINKSLTLIGAPTTIDGNGIGVTVDLGYAPRIFNVTIENLIVQNALDGFYLQLCSDCTIENCTVQNTTYAVNMDDARNQTIKNNVFKNNRYGIDFYGVGNTFIGNRFENTRYNAVHLFGSNNTFEGNVFVDNYLGVYVACYSYYNTFFHNTFVNSTYSNMQFWLSRSNLIYYNNFFKLGSQVTFEEFDYTNFWNNGTHGNYWSEYNGSDLYSGVYQNETGSDGIGDTPYTMTINNVDPYPLMTDPPFISTEEDEWGHHNGGHSGGGSGGNFLR